LNYYPFHLGDYAAHTAHLEPMEDLAYRRMLDLYYRTEAALPHIDSLCRLIRMKDHHVEVSNVLAEFFHWDSDGWTHARCDAEIAKMQDKQAKAKASAQASVKSREANAQRTLNECSSGVELPTPTPTPKEEISKLSLAGPRHLAESAPEQEQAKPGKPAIPDCPHLEILSLWAEVLPALPRHSPSLWNGARAAHLRARWRETAAVKGWTNKEQGLAYFRRVFTFVGNSKFLTGRVPNRDPTRRPMLIELEWLVSPRNWAKVLEGKYNEEVAAA